MRRLRRSLQIVFQDAYGSLDARMTVKGVLQKPFRIHGRPENGRVGEVLEEVVGLTGARRAKARRISNLAAQYRHKQVRRVMRGGRAAPSRSSLLFPAPSGCGSETRKMVKTTTVVLADDPTLAFDRCQLLGRM